MDGNNKAAAVAFETIFRLWVTGGKYQTFI